MDQLPDPYGYVAERTFLLTTFINGIPTSEDHRLEHSLLPLFSKGVTDIELKICQFIPLKTLATLGLISRNWHAAIGGKEFEERWEEGLLLLKFKKRKEYGAYRSFCLAATILKTFAKSPATPSKPDRDLVRLCASLYLQKVAIVSWDSVDTAAKAITKPTQKAVGWYEVALHRIRNGDYREAKEIAKNHLNNHAFATNIRNQISDFLMVNSNGSLGNSQNA